MRVKKTLLSAEELLRLSTSNACRYELVEGELYEMPPAGAEHGSIAMQIGTLLNAYVRRVESGRVFAAETGFILRRNPDTVRAPDASFVSNDHLPEGGLPRGFMELAPDLAVEVVSPNQTAREVEDKVRTWLEAGTSVVWVIDPANRSVAAHRAGVETITFFEQDALEEDELLPGFVCQVEDLFV